MKTKLHSFVNDDTICAIATPSGTGAIAIIRISGPEAIQKANSIFCPHKKNISLEKVKSHSLHYGAICNQGEEVDDVLLSIFRRPTSYTGEDSVEISCHGSIYIQQRIMEILLNIGCRQADPGEFTMRAFFNSKFDLSQAEAVADIISANSKGSHDLALHQMRGGFSSKIKELRSRLLDFASLIELELDFAEEDVEFANRAEMKSTVDSLLSEIKRLIDSFAMGNVIKHGIPVAIIGKPNVGKSTLLNALVNEERAIVSELPGTTRDTIEDLVIIDGVSFRFIDTAGLRDTDDEIESMGITRTKEKIQQSAIVLYVFDISLISKEELLEEMQEIEEFVKDSGKRIIMIANKTDQLVSVPRGFINMVEWETVFISAKRKENISLIIESLLKTVEDLQITDGAIVSNLRHLDALKEAHQALTNVNSGFAEQLPSDLIAIELRSALHHIGLITGEVANEELLGNIFGRFCIGK